MNKKEFSERDICTKFITPALVGSGWDIQKQIREEVSFTDGRIHVRGKKITRAQPKRADYILYYKANIPIAIIEAKDNNHSVGDGMQQALDYADILDIPFVFSSNGDGFLKHDRTVKEGQIEEELSLEGFPSPDELWQKYKIFKGIKAPSQEEVVLNDYYYDQGGKSPRYYQQIAINRTTEAIARGQDRILLVMATGTGKTFVASQIIWRLWKARKKKRILFLADRNVLVDQTMTNDFKHFGDKMTKIRNRQVDKSYEIYLALYQGVTGNEEIKNIYKEFSPDFFDLIVVDECHRGSAKEDSIWHEILKYFFSATQIGMTATPKETKYVSNINYFGEPIYTYSLKQGIEDGFLAPYKVVRVAIDRDLGWRPEEGKVDDNGFEVPDRIYNSKDYDRELILKRRREVVAKKVSEYLTKTNRFDKTIVFCVDIDHAEGMRQAIANENADLVQKNHKYVMRITGDHDLGKKELDNFIDPESPYPVIATTSKLMSTGVDAQTCKLVVLDKNINSMTEFKQIIGRGTRIRTDFDKYYFTIMDFRQATNLFADPDFDGDPVMIYEPKGDDPIAPPDDVIVEPEPPDEGGENGGETVIVDPIDPTGGGDGDPKPRKYVVGDVPVTVIHERVQYYGHDGKLITESLKDYTKKTLLKEFSSIDEFLQLWSHAEKKYAIIDQLEKQGIFFDDLCEEIGQDLDPFDIVCHIAFEQPALTRRERAENVKKRNYFTKYGDKARTVIDMLLEKYADEGIENLEELEILNVQPFPQFGSPIEIVNFFGGRDQYLEALKELEKEIYQIESKV
ncbi:MAG: DEAD/DEAH box helicase family protein [Candidatus Omnitrophica bacterium]|nr:DEAD/DEAH box helicase family protein [Candidatus Omnitrophota bacterium]